MTQDASNLPVCKHCDKPESPTCKNLCEFHEFDMDRKMGWFLKESYKLVQSYVSGGDLEELEKKQATLKKKIFEEWG